MASFWGWSIFGTTVGNCNVKAVDISTNGKLVACAAWAHVASLICSLSAYWLGGSPQTFYKYYTAKAVVLYGSRFYLYRSKNWHYYMLEFCYFANILLLLEVWVFPQSPTFHKVSNPHCNVILDSKYCVHAK